jgi:hypothetical protein
MKDNFKISGQVKLVLSGPDGSVKEEQTFKNLVVTTGLGLAAQALGNGTITVVSHVAVGTDSTAPSAANTALGAEIARTALASTDVTGTVVTYAGTIPAGTGTGALTEAGLLNAAVAGVMLSRVTFAVINKGAGDTLGIVWTITLGV